METRVLKVSVSAWPSVRSGIEATQDNPYAHLGPPCKHNSPIPQSHLKTY